MITIVAIAILFLLCAALTVTYIAVVRKRYSQFYCPKYSNLFLAHAYELVKFKRPSSETFLAWSQESGYDIFVLFSSWRVHLHVIDTKKIKVALCSSSLLKPKKNLLSEFCGVNLLGLKSLFTEPGSSIWSSKRKEFDPYFHTSGLQKGFKQILGIASELVESINCDAGTNITVLMQQHVSFVIAAFIMNMEDRTEFSLYTHKMANIFAGLSTRMRHKNTFWMPWAFTELKKEVLNDLHNVRTFFGNFVLSLNFDELDLRSCIGSLIKTNMEEDNLMIDLLVNELVMFFFAGIDTSIHTISFAFYELSRNEEVLSEIEKEIKSVSSKLILFLVEYALHFDCCSIETTIDILFYEILHDYNCIKLQKYFQVFGDKQYLDYSDFNELKYLDNFIKEVLRYHPIVSSVARETGSLGFTLCDKYIPRNTTVHINIECVQVGVKFWNIFQ